MQGLFANSRGLALASLLIPVALAGCSAPEREDIPGRYEYPNDAGETETLVLRSNGTGEVNSLPGMVAAFKLLNGVLGELARHLAYQLRAGEVASFEGVFAVVERRHTHGGAWVREARP